MAILSEKDDKAAMQHVLFTVASEILLVCATVLFFFAYSQLPTFSAAAASLVIIFIGSLLCWQSYRTARAIMFLSLLVSELSILKYFDLFILFAILDIVVFAALILSGLQKEEQSKP